MINKKPLLFSLLITLLTLTACNQAPKQAPEPEAAKETTSAKDAVLQNIMTRSTCRVFQHKEIDEKTIETLLRAAMAAPTALNAQPWHFIVINDREILKQLATASPHTGMLESAPVAIAVCGDVTKKLDADEGIYWLQDVCAATENLLLAAHALGLGATWTGSYPVQSRYEIAKVALQLPDHILPVTIVALGYPAMEPQVKDKWNPDNISYNGYQK